MRRSIAGGWRRLAFVVCLASAISVRAQELERAAPVPVAHDLAGARVADRHAGESGAFGVGLETAAAYAAEVWRRQRLRHQMRLPLSWSGGSQETGPTSNPATKGVAGATLLAGVDRGLIKLDDRAGKYDPKFGQGGSRTVGTGLPRSRSANLPR